MYGPDQTRPATAGKREKEQEQSKITQTFASLWLVVEKRRPVDMNVVNVTQMR
jgi:hypothetical protein